MRALGGGSLGLKNSRIRRRAQRLLNGGSTILLFLMLTAQASAGPIAVGILQFNTFSPASPPDTPGVNFFLISNFTGLNSLPPDFPMAADITFQNLELILAIGS